MLAAAGAEQPAVAARWWVAVPCQAQPDRIGDELRSLRARSRGRTLWSCTVRRRWTGARITGLIEVALQAAGIETYRLDGTQTLALVWERLHPATRTDCSFDKLAIVCQTAHATTGQPARAVHHAFVDAAWDGAARRVDAGEDAGWLRDADGTLEEVLHLGSPAGVYRSGVAVVSGVLPAAGDVGGAGRCGRPGALGRLAGAAGLRQPPRIPPRSNPQWPQGGFLGNFLQ